MQKMGMQKICERVREFQWGKLIDNPQVFHSYFTERDRPL
jgi:hypothetical protein